jgi:hypothetical protein
VKVKGEKEEVLREFRRVRDEIKEKIAVFFSSRKNN